MGRKPNTILQSEVVELISLLKKKGSVPIENLADCKLLSNNIFAVTGKYISESTIKRFFGFHQSKFQPASETVKILKEYISIDIYKLSNNNVSVDFILDFFNPRHFENIEKSDKSFQAASRSIALSLKKNPVLFEKVMEPIAKSKFGRAFYYELFPDYDCLADFQYKGYEKYLEYEKSYEGKIFANCILFLKYLFENNLVMMKSQWTIILKLYKKDKTLHPFVLGRVYQIKLIGSFYFLKTNLNSIINEVFLLEKKQSRSTKGMFKEFPGFHYFVCDGLWHSEFYKELFKLSKTALTEFKQYDEFKWKGYYDELYLYNSLALVKLNEPKEAAKQIKFINPDKFYFISKGYYDLLFKELKNSLQ